ncbi:hypothetical protein BDQ12DRAFT_728912 [Crucibulum laeve]|uniref:Uncharacterized protein n=1 Tax=Crucibulum laeve TaxID=68775 RepID=A0A5C3LG91_9AGAR|nr:hypothetical protein BDQ12DRAFT_728912 [Crucibulum laeve]
MFSISLFQRDSLSDAPPRLASLEEPNEITLHSGMNSSQCSITSYPDIPSEEGSEIDEITPSMSTSQLMCIWDNRVQTRRIHAGRSIVTSIDYYAQSISKETDSSHYYPATSSFSELGVEKSINDTSTLLSEPPPIGIGYQLQTDIKQLKSEVFQMKHTLEDINASLQLLCSLLNTEKPGNMSIPTS